MPQLDVFLLVLRLFFIVLLYLFLIQVIISINRDLQKTAAANADAQNQPAPVPGQLIVVDSGRSSIALGTRFALEPDTTIGRYPTNTIQIEDGFISGEHTHIWQRNGTWYVEDLQSKNGTYVNEQSALKALPAKPGDIVRVGFLRFKLTQ